jgi:hypothetical protein
MGIAGRNRIYSKSGIMSLMGGLGPGRDFRASSKSRTGIVIILGLLFASACGGTGHRVAVSGTLAGKLEAVGGPPGVPPRPLPGTITISGGPGNRSATAGADGAFSVTLPPGSYTVVAHSPQFVINGADGWCLPGNPGAVTVRSGATATVLIVCSES